MLGRPPSTATIRYCAMYTPGVKSPQANGVVELFFGTLKYEHLYRGYVGDALDMEVHRFRIIYNIIRPHQALADRTPKQAYLDGKTQPTSRHKTRRVRQPPTCAQSSNSDIGKKPRYEIGCGG
jgi:transposase InsO family protein